MERYLNPVNWFKVVSLANKQQKNFIVVLVFSAYSNEEGWRGRSSYSIIAIFYSFFLFFCLFILSTVHYHHIEPEMESMRTKRKLVIRIRVLNFPPPSPSNFNAMFFQFDRRWNWYDWIEEKLKEILESSIYSMGIEDDGSGSMGWSRLAECHVIVKLYNWRWEVEMIRTDLHPSANYLVSSEMDWKWILSFAADRWTAISFERKWGVPEKRRYLWPAVINKC